VVATDADGVAQVQWILGNHPQLPVQRMEARLLDEAGQPTSQTTLFTAHHLVAREISWVIPSILQPHLPNPSDHLQAALDGVAQAFARLGLPFFAIQPKITTFSQPIPIVSTATITLGFWTGVDLQAVFPANFNVTVNQLEFGLIVQMERPFSVAHHETVRLVGALSQSGTTARWTLPQATRTWLQSELGQNTSPRRVIVDFLPHAFGMNGHPQRWMFTLTV
jgi:hypothetical protein